MNATFNPKNKSLYKGRLAKWLYSLAGQPCTVLARGEAPPDQTGTGKPYPFAIIRFPSSLQQFVVRLQDVQEVGS